MPNRSQLDVIMFEIWASSQFMVKVPGHMTINWENKLDSRYLKFYQTYCFNYL